jgi:hypothetical protein
MIIHCRDNRLTDGGEIVSLTSTVVPGSRKRRQSANTAAGGRTRPVSNETAKYAYGS